MLNKKQQRLRRARQTRIRIATQGVARLTEKKENKVKKIKNQSLIRKKRKERRMEKQKT